MSSADLTDTTAEQLRLISVPTSAPAGAGRTSPGARRFRVPAKLRLDEQTRRIGLAGVAEARAILAAQAQRRAEQELAGRQPLPRRHAA